MITLFGNRVAFLLMLIYDMVLLCSCYLCEFILFCHVLSCHAMSCLVISSPKLCNMSCHGMSCYDISYIHTYIYGLSITRIKIYGEAGERFPRISYMVQFFNHTVTVCGLGTCMNGNSEMKADRRRYQCIF